MSKIRNLLIRLYTPLVDTDPEIFLRILKRKHLETIINRLEIGISNQLNSTNYPPAIHGFEGLAFLFWPTPVNRGILRQDIDEAAALYRIISSMKNPYGVEIGRFSGGSTILLAAAVGPSGKLVSIDIAPQDDQTLSHVLSHYNFLERVNLIKCDANEILLEGDSLYDFVFIDGDHSYEGAKRDHNKWGAKVKINGYIVHHDMSATRIHATQHKALAKLRADILNMQANEIKLVEEVGSMCFFKERLLAGTLFRITKRMKTIAIIPARLASTRLPSKVLADICGKPLVQHVWERVSQAKNIDSVIVATDSPEVVQVVSGWGGKAILTDPACQSGTERIASIVGELNADLILNVQGDEPLVDPEMLDTLIASWMSAPCDLITLVYSITNMEDLINPNVVKVARAQSGRALYFSRSPIPYVRDYPQEKWLEHQAFWGHIGVYGYRPAVISKYAGLPASPLQAAESLEQLRFLEAGYAIQTVETTYRSIAVDTQEDLDKVRRMICE